MALGVNRRTRWKGALLFMMVSFLPINPMDHCLFKAGTAGDKLGCLYFPLGILLWQPNRPRSNRGSMQQLPHPFCGQKPKGNLVKISSMKICSVNGHGVSVSLKGQQWLGKNRKFGINKTASLAKRKESILTDWRG